MNFGWLEWSIFLVGLFLVFKAYGYLRDHEGSDDGSWLEGFGAFYLAPLVAPVMPFIWMNQWAEQRREAVQIRSGGGPLSDAQRRDQRNVVVGAVLMLGVVAAVLYLLLSLSR